MCQRRNGLDKGDENAERDYHHQDNVEGTSTRRVRLKQYFIKLFFFKPFGFLHHIIFFCFCVQSYEKFGEKLFFFSFFRTFAGRMDDKEYLLSLIREGEHQQQDFKYRVADACKLAKSVSAFANTDGGRLLIGVRDDGHLSGVRSEEEIFMMHQAAYKFCKPEASIKFDTYHVDKRTIVVATVPPSGKRPICALDEEGRQRAYVRIDDENIVASPVHLALWREAQKQQGTMITYDDDIRLLLDSIQGQLPLNRIVRLSRLPRHKVITLLARLIRFGNVRCEYINQQFLFSMA